MTKAESERSHLKFEVGSQEETDIADLTSTALIRVVRSLSQDAEEQLHELRRLSCPDVVDELALQFHDQAVLVDTSSPPNLTPLDPGSPTRKRICRHGPLTRLSSSGSWTTRSDEAGRGAGRLQLPAR
jgi:hypothetical protein